MFNQTLIGVAVGAILMAIGSSAKAIIDVSVLKAENRNTKEHVLEIKADVKEIKRDLKKTWK